MNSTAKTIVIWIGFIGLVVLAYRFVQSQGDGPEPRIPYSQFTESVRNDEVAAVTIVELEITIVTTNGQKFITELPFEDPKLLELLTEHKVKIEAKRPTSNLWLSVLVNSTPFLLIIGLWIFFIRQMRKRGNTALCSVNSRAQLLTADQKMDSLTSDRLAIRETVENWALWRDAGDWERFSTVWHSDGWMTATWFQGPATLFIEVSRIGFNNGVNILHFLGGFTCEVVGVRAISQVKMTIMQRAEVDGVLVDVACTGRFYDFFEKRGDRWGIVRRQPIYEKDRLDPVDPSAALKLDAALLASFPEGYRHLAYLQSKNGFGVKQGLPGLRGPAVEKLYGEGRAWLAGSVRPGEPL